MLLLLVLGIKPNIYAVVISAWHKANIYAVVSVWHKA